MDTDLDRVLHKIRDILNLAERAGSDGERAAALEAVQRLMAKHKLTQDEVDGVGSQWESMILDRGHHVRRACCRAVCGLLCHFEVVANLRDGAVTISGERHHVQVAKYVYVFLMRTFAEKWKASGLRKGSPAFFEGVAYTLWKKLIGPEQYKEMVKEMLAELAKGKGSKRRLAPLPEEFYVGGDAGRDIDIRTPLAAPAGPVLKLEAFA